MSMGILRQSRILLDTNSSAVSLAIVAELPRMTLDQGEAACTASLRMTLDQGEVACTASLHMTPDQGEAAFTPHQS